MKKLGLLVLLVFSVLAVPAVLAQTQEKLSLNFGTSSSYSLELNTGNTAFLSVALSGIPDKNVSQIYVQYDSTLQGRVFCAPSPLKVSGTTADFTCVVTPGDPLDGYITFVALDANGNVYSSATRLHLVVTYSQQWFTSRTLATVGSTITVGGHTVVVRSASFLYVVLSVDNSPVTAFVNEDTSLAKDLWVAYKGYDPDTRQVFLEFRSHSPISASVQEKHYFLAVPPEVYREGNVAKVAVYTNCSSVQYHYGASQKWQDLSVSSGRADIVVDENVSKLYLRCSDDANVAATVLVKNPPVVKVQPDRNEFVSWCTGHGYILRDSCPKPDCTSYCAANGWVKPPAGYVCNFTRPGSNTDYTRAVVGVAVLVVLVGLWYLYRNGRIKLPSKPSVKDASQPRPLEEAHDIQ